LKLWDFKLLTDENIHPAVVQFLRSQGFDVLDVATANLQGGLDVDVLRHAVTEGRVVVTHDSDFGTLAMLAGEPIIGIVYLRPGHIDTKFTTESIHELLRAALDLTPPFILVAHRRDGYVTIRLRTM
jgi:predicted nuclease of predicted toxin-antitoxin system